MSKLKASEKVEPVGRTNVAEFFGLPLNHVLIESQPNTYSIFIKDNDEAQQKYKQVNQYGNTVGRPGGYNFEQKLMVMWNGKKIQPV